MPINVETLGGVPATTLSSPIITGATSIPLTSGTGFPDGGNGAFYIVIDRGLSTQEVVKCASRSGTTITVASGGRGADGSTDQGHDSGATVEHVAAAETIQALVDHADQTTGSPHGSAYLTPSGNAATASKWQTARTLALSGDVTGSNTIDGSGNVTITTAVADDSHDHTSSISGSAATLTTARSIALGGDLSGSQTFDGSGDITITADVDVQSTTSTAAVWTQTATLTTSTDNLVILPLGDITIVLGLTQFASAGTTNGDLVVDLSGTSVDLTSSQAYVFGTYRFFDSGSSTITTGMVAGRDTAADTLEFLRVGTLATGSENLGQAITIASGDTLWWGAVIHTG